MSSNNLVLVKIVVVSLNLPTKVNELIVRAQVIHDTMCKKERYAASADKLAKLDSANKELLRLQTACKAKPPTALIVTRDLAKNEVKMHLSHLRMDVQDLTHHSQEDAAVVVSDANMFIKNFANNKKFQNKAKRGTESGSVILYAVGQGYHDWRMSLDNINWVEMKSTSTAKNIIKNLTIGQVYYFQNRKVLTKGRESAWSQSVNITVR